MGENKPEVRDAGAEPVSRRRFLGTGAAGVACAAVVAGCQQAPHTENTTPKMFNAADPAEYPWPAVSYAEGSEAVRQFEEKLKIEYVPIGGIHSVTLATSDKEPGVSIQVGYVADRGKPVLPEEFAYEFPPESQRMKTVPVRSRPEPMPKPHGIKLGHRARHASLTVGSAGSVGWCIRFNGAVVCVSACHVLRDNLDSTGGIGDNVELNGTVNADLHCYQPIVFGGAANTWDIAMAKFRDEADVDRVFRACGDGTVPASYPMRLSPVAGPTTGEVFDKVGNGTPVCGTGKFVETGSCAVEYANGKIAVYKGQLYFTKFAGPGDSGAVITRDDDLSVTGLHHTGTSTRSISCPMFLLPWIRGANFVLPNGKQLPNYTAIAVPAPACCGAPVVPW